MTHRDGFLGVGGLAPYATNEYGQAAGGQAADEDRATRLWWARAWTKRIFLPPFHHHAGSPRRKRHLRLQRKENELRL